MRFLFIMVVITIITFSNNSYAGVFIGGEASSVGNHPILPTLTSDPSTGLNLTFQNEKEMFLISKMKGGVSLIGHIPHQGGEPPQELVLSSSMRKDFRWFNLEMGNAIRQMYKPSENNTGSLGDVSTRINISHKPLMGLCGNVFGIHQYSHNRKTHKRFHGGCRNIKRYSGR